MYADKEQDHEKRANQEGSYSLYNYMYHYLLDNFEPGYVPSAAHMLLFREAKAYCLKGGKHKSDDEIREAIKAAIKAFNENDREHGDTANNLGKKHDSQFEDVKSALKDLRW